MKVYDVLYYLLLVVPGTLLNAAPVTINFDFDPAGNPVAAPATFERTMPLTELYAPLGVHFAGPSADFGGAILNMGAGFGISPFSGTNVLAFNRITYATEWAYSETCA